MYTLYLMCVTYCIYYLKIFQKSLSSEEEKKSVKIMRKTQEIPSLTSEF